MRYVKHITIDDDEDNMRFDRWFMIHYHHISFAHLQKLLRSGQIRLNGGRVKSNFRLRAGQDVRIPPIVHASIIKNDKKPLIDQSINYLDASKFLNSILIYEDSEIYVFNKPSGIPVQGGSGITYHIDGLLNYWLGSKGEKTYLIHRLDQETSGILIVARTRASAQSLTEAFRMRKVKKIYWSLVRGVPNKNKFFISNWLIKKCRIGGDYVQVADNSEKGANHAISYFRIIDCSEKFCWLEMQPHTGRTHQLRVHALHIGHPIVGDKKYYINNSIGDYSSKIKNHLYLHARYIDFPHPSGGRLQITAPLSDHMAKTWDSFGFDYSTDVCFKRL
ncbi:RluA family pseudouridine synthase [Candidatus Liberibacter americanus]|uniref:Pseudouridine synthase n=1 Tax=Candidatus Liberibacter americanus str. Sao Paulo TaxID=1261131 RepID=U6B922_9HYPH|nr:RluA family pseudouridine synthase [Candidatus Liberibacter americanus]AHA28356.1 Pseudouridylate synthase, 23S RNA-specific [Candidatus Liberibacter americanus str. Sao Paulo]EMS36645.1 ribosomal large subunit pseudouridine synthase C [Candidatus Liberibacter americanus PW_SP]